MAKKPEQPTYVAKLPVLCPSCGQDTLACVLHEHKGSGVMVPGDGDVVQCSSCKKCYSANLVPNHD